MREPPDSVDGVLLGDDSLPSTCQAVTWLTNRCLADGQGAGSLFQQSSYRLISGYRTQSDVNFGYCLPGFFIAGVPDGLRAKPLSPVGSGATSSFFGGAFLTFAAIPNANATKFVNFLNRV